MLILCGAFVQSLQYAFEERMMTGEVSAPPLLVIGMEVGRAAAPRHAARVRRLCRSPAASALTPGRPRDLCPAAPPAQGLWGMLLCTCVLYPLAWVLPGSEHGHVEDPFNTYAMIANSATVRLVLCWYFLFVFLYNSFGVLVTYLLNSIWHAILDNFRPITVWGADLLIFYAISHGAFGEEWTSWSYLELAGLGILLLGTAVYNASIRLPCFTYEPGTAMMATPMMQRSPLLSSALGHTRAQGLPTTRATTQYVAPQPQHSTQYGFITVST